MTVQRRHSLLPLVELETRDEGPRVLRGYAAVFYQEGNRDTEYSLWDNAVERLAPTAFDRALKAKQDVRGLFNHDPSQILGRSKAGTLRLSTDKTGLRYEIELPDTQRARDLVEHVQRGDVTGSSFSFVPTETRWEKGDDDEQEIRVISSVDLWDVGPVTFPAYEATTVSSRDQEAARVEADDYRAAKAMTVQTLIFSKERFETAAECKEWARENEFKADKVDDNTSYRIRQRDPGEFLEGTFRTISLTDGVQAVVGKLKERQDHTDKLKRAVHVEFELKHT